MKTRFVRPDDHLEDDEELILRGGELNPAILRADAQRMFDIYRVYGISVFALRGATIDELAQQTPLMRFPLFTIMTVGTVRAAGLRLEPTGRNRRHYTVMFDDLDEVGSVLAAEHQIWINPYHEA